MNRIFFLIIHCIISTALYAIDWDTVTSSGNYYYGTGTGTTEQEAGNAALDNLLQMVAVHVSSDFKSIYDGTSVNGITDYKESVRQCVQTYAQSSLTNVQTWPVGKKDGLFIVRKYMLVSELEKMYEERIDRLKNMVRLADWSLEIGNVDIALQHYYWAYTLLRSLQFPNKVIDSNGNILINTLPIKIRDILNNIKVEYMGRTGCEVNLRFTYKGTPTTIDFTYNDGRADNCDGKAEGGNAFVEMAPGHENDEAIHLNIEYEYKNWARGDAEMQSVLKVIPKRSFCKEFVVQTPVNRTTKIVSSVSSPKENYTLINSKIDNAIYQKNIDKVIKALSMRQYDMAADCFTGRGLSNFLKLIRGRKGRVIGKPNITLYPYADNKVVARGIQMAFSVTERGHKTTFVEDIILTFDRDGMISNLTFGIGHQAEEDLLNKNVSWGEKVRQQIMGFLENYKTAYCLKDTAYIRSIFDDNATIIVGHVAKRTTYPGMTDCQLSAIGREIVTYRQYTKTEYIRNLRRTCERNNFINIKFTNNDIMKLDKLKGDIFSIQIGQEYNSSTYADKGFLFLMVDMTNAEEPLIKIRTWQPKPDPQFGLYGAGHFYN